MTLLDVDSVSKSYGGVRALDAVSLTIDEGEIVGLMGANGAGKTTLFGVIAGHERPDAGAIVFDGRRIDGLGPRRVCHLGIARTFQTVRPFRGLTVAENLELAATFGRRPSRDRAAARARAAAVLDDFAFAARADVAAGSLTLAEQKRLELARAVATGARLVLVDEVMAGLNPAEVADMMATVRRVRERHGLTLFVIEHVMTALMQLVRRVVVLHHGVLIAAGAPEDVARDERVLAAYVGVAP